MATCSLYISAWESVLAGGGGGGGGGGVVTFGVVPFLSACSYKYMRSQNEVAVTSNIPEVDFSSNGWVGFR